MTTDSARPAAPSDPLAAPATVPTTRPHNDERLSPPMTDEGTRGGGGHRDEPVAARPEAARPGGAGDEAAGMASLIAPEQGEGYRARWTAVQGDFIDEPRTAVTDADALVGEVLDQLADTFRNQRVALEQQWADDESSTEDLRIALRRYRTFFDRLLSL